MLVVFGSLAMASPPDAMAWWDVQRAGANLFNSEPTAERFEAAHSAGIEVVRLAPNKWTAEGRDFLVGDADAYAGLPEADLARLVVALDQANAAGLKVVLTTLTLPGARWRQHNGGEPDRRLYAEPTFAAQSVQFWSDLATALRDHPAIVAYNLINEPDTASESDAAMLGDLYLQTIAAIRKVDARTPIMLDAPMQADPIGFAMLKHVSDAHVLYAFHFYQPWEHTTWRKNQGSVAYGSEGWTRAELEAALKPVDDWRVAHNVPANRVVAAEFGCDRRVAGVERYLADTIGLFDARGTHWMFYSFREDTWHGFDYEVDELPTEYWMALERGEVPQPSRGGSPAFEVLERALKVVKTRTR